MNAKNSIIKNGNNSTICANSKLNYRFIFYFIFEFKKKINCLII